MAAPPPPSGHSGTPGTGTDSGQGLSGWTAARIVSVVIGAVLVLISLGLLGAGGTALWAETTQRDAGGYLDLGTATYSTTGYALASDTIDLHAAGNGWDAAKSLFGTVRIRATSADSAIPVFVGIAATDAASRYLTGVQYATVRNAAGHGVTYIQHGGAGPATLPATARFWTAHADGTSTQTLTWQVMSGGWTVVAMNADGSRPVHVRVNVAATLPSLPWVAAGLLTAGVIFLAAGAVLIAVPLRRASRDIAGRRT